MDLHVSLAGAPHLQAGVYQQLKAAILDGRLARRERLPATRELAARLGVGRNTVLHAYERLISEGFLEARVGDGTYVADLVAASHRRAPRGGVITARTAFRSPPPEEPAPPTAPRWDFQVGAPDPSLFPWDEWRRLLARQFRRPGRRAAAAPPYLPPQGDPRARAAIARHLGVSRAVKASPDDVLLTSGAQQALDLIGRVLIEPPRPGARTCVAVEDPGYLPARHLFRSLGARVVPVRVDAEGLVVDALPPDARLVYVTPSHQFPLGVPMSLPRRLALLAWAERHGAAIIEDDYDSELRFDGRPLDPLQSLDAHGRVLYVGTFSKVLVPSLRLGFAVVPASLMPALLHAKRLSDAHGAPEPQRALAELIDDGTFARHLRRLLRVYGERRAQLLTSLDRHLGAAVRVLPSVAGLHHSLTFADRSLDDVALAARAARLGLSLQPLTPYAQHQRRAPGLAIGYGAISAARIDEGIKQLACLVR